MPEIPPSAIDGFGVDDIGRTVTVEGYPGVGILEFVGMHHKKKKPFCGVVFKSVAEGDLLKGAMNGIVAEKGIEFMYFRTDGLNGDAFQPNGVLIPAGKVDFAVASQILRKASKKGKDTLGDLPTSPNSKKDRRATTASFKQQKKDDTKARKEKEKAEAKARKDKKAALAKAKKKQSVRRAAQDITGLLIPTEPWFAQTRKKLAARSRSDVEALKSKLGMQSGTLMTRYQQKKKTYEEVLRLDFDHMRIVISADGGATEKFIPLHEVREVRYGVKANDTKGFRTCSDGVIRPELAFAILYGWEFTLEQACFVAMNEPDYTAWTEGLEGFCPYAAPELYTHDKLLPRWLASTWHEITQKLRAPNGLGVKDMKTVMRSFSLKTENKQNKELFDQFSGPDNLLHFEGFQQLYFDVSALDATEHYFNEVVISSNVAKEVDLTKLTAFFVREGMLDLTVEKCTQIARRYRDHKGRFTLSSLLQYLHSDENEAINPEAYALGAMDMSQNLAHYLIASSHNTYLLGDQFKSESSIEAYISTYREGCRCVEYDTWDGPKGEPIVYHGYTLTTKIKFEDVVKATADHMFWHSVYPMIISCENHCTLKQQEFMAHRFKAYFGECLISSPAPGASKRAYASPDQLKGRVILKHKKLKMGQTDVELSTKGDDMSSAIKNEKLMVEDQVDGKWQQHYFVLTEDQVFYSEPQEEEKDGDDEPHFVPGQELHEGEVWFHAIVPGGRSEANARVKTYVIKELVPKDLEPSGAFLVRVSNRPGEMTLAFWTQATQSVQNVNIKRTAENEYYMVPTQLFRSIFELIQYHKLEPLEGPNFKTCLTAEITKPPDYTDQAWYKGQLARAEAEAMVQMIGADGVFLVRESAKGESDQKFAITFRAEGKTKHCRIVREGATFYIGDSEFPSLTELVEHYKTNHLYRKLKLRYPVDEALLERHKDSAEDDDSEDLYTSQDLYAEPNAMAAAAQQNMIACKAVYSYKAKAADELSFEKGAVIVNVMKSDSGWWRGDRAGRICLRFPSNFVEEIQLDRIGESSKSDQENILGDMEQGRYGVGTVTFRYLKGQHGDDPSRQYLAEFSAPGDKKPLRVGSHDEKNLLDWGIKLMDLKKGKGRGSTGSSGGGDSVKKKKKMKIAPILSDLIFYVMSVHFDSFEASKRDDVFNAMSSFKEGPAVKMAGELAGEPVAWNAYNLTQLSRIYPAGKRVNSSNYDPQSLWNVGCQLVALNYQTGDQPMWLNRGVFRQNGMCGIIKKPTAMLVPSFNPFKSLSYAQNSDTCYLKVKVMSGRHLGMNSKGMVSPMVSLWVSGVESDMGEIKSHEVESNGINPEFMEDEEFEFMVTLPEMASLGVTVYNVDMFGDPEPVGGQVYPLGSRANSGIRTGFRSVPLKNIDNNSLGLASVLLKITVTWGSTDPQKQQMLEELRAVQKERDAIVERVVLTGRNRAGDQSAQHELIAINEKLATLEQNLETMDL